LFYEIRKLFQVRSEGWAVRKEGNLQATRVVRTQAEAISIGRKWVKQGKSSFVIVHDKKGNFIRK